MDSSAQNLSPTRPDTTSLESTHEPPRKRRRARTKSTKASPASENEGYQVRFVLAPSAALPTPVSPCRSINMQSSSIPPLSPNGNLVGKIPLETSWQGLRWVSPSSTYSPDRDRKRRRSVSCHVSAPVVPPETSSHVFQVEAQVPFDIANQVQIRPDHRSARSKDPSPPSKACANVNNVARSSLVSLNPTVSRLALVQGDQDRILLQDLHQDGIPAASLVKNSPCRCSSALPQLSPSNTKKTLGSGLSTSARLTGNYIKTPSQPKDVLDSAQSDSVSDLQSLAREVHPSPLTNRNSYSSATRMPAYIDPSWSSDFSSKIHSSAAHQVSQDTSTTSGDNCNGAYTHESQLYYTSQESSQSPDRQIPWNMPNAAGIPAYTHLSQSASNVSNGLPLHHHPPVQGQNEVRPDAGHIRQNLVTIADQICAPPHPQHLLYPPFIAQLVPRSAFSPNVMATTSNPSAREQASLHTSAPYPVPFGLPHLVPLSVPWIATPNGPVQCHPLWPQPLLPEHLASSSSPFHSLQCLPHPTVFPVPQAYPAPSYSPMPVSPLQQPHGPAYPTNIPVAFPPWMYFPPDPAWSKLPAHPKPKGKRGKKGQGQFERFMHWTGNEYRCPFCPRMFSRGNSLALHMKWHAETHRRMLEDYSKKAMDALHSTLSRSSSYDMPSSSAGYSSTESTPIASPLPESVPICEAAVAEFVGPITPLASPPLIPSNLKRGDTCFSSLRIRRTTGESSASSEWREELFGPDDSQVSLTYSSS